MPEMTFARMPVSWVTRRRNSPPFSASLTALVANLVFKAGPGFYFLYNLFPPENALDQATGEDVLNSTIVRLGGLNMASTGLYACLLARYGVRGIPNLILFQGGQVKEQIVGAVPKSQLLKAISTVVA